MNSFKIIFMNFKQNIKTSLLYLCAMIFSVASYYNFLSMRHNPQFLEAQEVSSYVQSASFSASMLMVMFLIFFIVYSSNFFLNQRKKEIGVYAFMGIDNYKIAFIFASEGLLLGTLSVIIGLAIGIVFSKLFMMMIAKIALLNITIEFFISKKAVFSTIIVYSVILGITFLKGYFQVIRTNLIDLLNSLKKEEELPKINYFKGIASIIIIGIGYYIAINYEILGFGNTLMVTILLTIWGTYWMFNSFFSIVIRYFINKKSFLYRGTNIISISNIAFRIKNNYKTLAAVAILITTSITSFATVSSLRYFADHNHKVEVPYTVSYVSDDEDIIEKVDNIIEASSHNVQLTERVNFLYVPITENLQSADQVVVVKLSDFQNIILDLEVENKEKIIPKFNLSKGEAGYVHKPGTAISILDLNNIRIGDMDFNIRTDIKVPLLGAGIPYPCIVVDDDDYLQLKSSFEEKQFNGIILDNEENTKDLTMELANAVHPGEISLYTYYVAGATFYDMVGIVYFVGGFLALVFIFATGSIIYFKILSESFRDRNKYQILKKVGTTDLEISNSVSKQVGIFFILPLIIGSIHSIVAISVLGKVMEYSFILPTAISIVIFALVYGVFYLFTTRKFITVVK
ncbi:ABC transporter permease [Alkaliphilus sp. MSJ-5]|uniref:ABC transporter permease n=1 Tax=Alkaliphilus flagellatus TaxID=2841507 RepID=A0ABS6G1P9_9FIRM|nr:ABC transporter permease [Alkaliphilus flagellatus]MBU5676407.1 ABC transporter permease [Alkaliphilus flagellatus]